MDSTLLFYSYYGLNGLEKFYHFNEELDTIIFISSAKETPILHDSLKQLIRIRKNSIKLTLLERMTIHL